MAFPDELERVRLPDAFKGLIKTIAFRCFEDLGRDQSVLRPMFSTNHLRKLSGWWHYRPASCRAPLHCYY